MEHKYEWNKIYFCHWQEAKIVKVKIQMILYDVNGDILYRVAPIHTNPAREVLHRTKILYDTFEECQRAAIEKEFRYIEEKYSKLCEEV